MSVQTNRYSHIFEKLTTMNIDRWVNKYANRYVDVDASILGLKSIHIGESIGLG